MASRYNTRLRSKTPDTPPASHLIDHDSGEEFELDEASLADAKAGTWGSVFGSSDEEDQPTQDHNTPPPPLSLFLWLLGRRLALR